MATAPSLSTNPPQEAGILIGRIAFRHDVSRVDTAKLVITARPQMKDWNVETTVGEAGAGFAASLPAGDYSFEEWGIFGPQGHTGGNDPFLADRRTSLPGWFSVSAGSVSCLGEMFPIALGQENRRTTLAFDLSACESLVRDVRNQVPAVASWPVREALSASIKPSNSSSATADPAAAGDTELLVSAWLGRSFVRNRPGMADYVATAIELPESMHARLKGTKARICVSSVGSVYHATVLSQSDASLATTVEQALRTIPFQPLKIESRARRFCFVDTVMARSSLPNIRR